MCVCVCACVLVLVEDFLSFASPGDGKLKIGLLVIILKLWWGPILNTGYGSGHPISKALLHWKSVKEANNLHIGACPIA